MYTLPRGVDIDPLIVLEEPPPELLPPKDTEPRGVDTDTFPFEETVADAPEPPTETEPIGEEIETTEAAGVAGRM